MNIIIRETTRPGFEQITTLGERFYLRMSDRKEFFSNTWICDYVPMDDYVVDWIARVGSDHAKEYRASQGRYGGKVHKAIECILENGRIGMHETFPDNDEGSSFSELTPREYRAVMTFKDWWNDFKYDEIDVLVGQYKSGAKKGQDKYEKQRVEVKLEVLEREATHYNEELGYACTLDLRVKRGEELWLIDYKISKYVGLSYKCQLAGIANCDGLRGIPHRRAILQVGYEENKKGWKFNEVEDTWDCWLAAHTFFKRENADKRPKQYEYPVTLYLDSKDDLTEQLTASIKQQKKK